MYNYSINYNDQKQELMKFVEKLKLNEYKISRLDKRLLEIFD